MKAGILWLTVVAVLLVSSTAKDSMKCRSQNQCNQTQCCAGLTHKYAGECLDQPQLKELCIPNLPPGAGKCPCRVGLTCKPFNTTVNATQSIMGLCVVPDHDTDEVEERRGWFDIENQYV